MKRLLAIPAAGTVAALIVVLLAHEPREEEPGPVFPEPPPVLPDDDSDLSRRPVRSSAERVGESPEGAKADAPVPDDAAKPAEEPEKKPVPKKPPPPPPPPLTEYPLRLEKDGSLVDLANRSRTFADTAAVIAELAHNEVRHRIILSNGEGVEEAALDSLLESLSAKFQVRKVYRAPKKEE